MCALITDPMLKERLIAERRESGADRFDEVWEGLYIMSPIANNEHQFLATELAAILIASVDWAGLGKTAAGVNVSDRKKGWTHNYRCPDVVVFLNDTAAENCGEFWYGGPDLAIEITSPGDRTLEKLPFYAQVKTTELLVIDRDPWQLKLFRNDGTQMVEIGLSECDSPAILSSQVVPLDWQIKGRPTEPEIHVRHQDGEPKWVVTTK